MFNPSISGTASRRRPRSLFLGLPVVWALLFFACGRPSTPATGSSAGPADPDGAYTSRLELSNLGLAKGESYLGDSVHYVEGEIRNLGDRVVQRVDLTLTFKDSLGQVVLKETRHALDYRAGKGLEPQKSAKFQIGFDHLPKDWNYYLPDAQINSIVLR